MNQKHAARIAKILEGDEKLRGSTIQDFFSELASGHHDVTDTETGLTLEEKVLFALAKRYSKESACLQSQVEESMGKMPDVWCTATTLCGRADGILNYLISSLEGRACGGAFKAPNVSRFSCKE